MLTTILEYFAEIIASMASILAGYLGFLTYRRSNKIRQLKEENEHLKRRINRVTSKVNPESGKQLIEEATTSIQILDVNALGPLHHAREELICFLKNKSSILQIILLDPDSKMFKERELQEKDSARRIFTEWVAALTTIKDMEFHSGGQVELRLSTDPPDRYLLVVDALGGLSDYSKMLINYYPKQLGMRGYSGEQFLSEYLYERDRDSFLKNLEYINECLKRAERVELDTLLTKFAGKVHSEQSKCSRPLTAPADLRCWAGRRWSRWIKLKLMTHR